MHNRASCSWRARCSCVACCRSRARLRRADPHLAESDYSDFEKGILKNLSLRSDGLLTLAPQFQELFDSSSAYLWALARDSKGNLYAGGGPGAKLYRISPEGEKKDARRVRGLEIHAIAIDRKDRVYAATSPDGKVYRVAADGKSEVFYDPKAEIHLGAGLRQPGRPVRRDRRSGRDPSRHAGRQGQRVLSRAKRRTCARWRSMRTDNLIVGTEPGGLVMRISPAGEGFVLYQMAKKEVTAVAVAQGRIDLRGGGGQQVGVARLLRRRRPHPPPARGRTSVARGAAALRVTVRAAAPPPAYRGGVQRDHQRRLRTLSHRSRRQSAEGLEPRAGYRLRDRVRRRRPSAGRHRQQGLHLPHRFGRRCTRRC